MSTSEDDKELVRSFWEEAPPPLPAGGSRPGGLFIPAAGSDGPD